MAAQTRQLNPQNIVGQRITCQLETMRMENTDAETRSTQVAFSSDVPIEHWPRGFVKLSHDPQHVRLGRMQSQGTVLYNHDPNQFVGRASDVTLEAGRARAKVRFSRSALGEEVWQNVQDELLTGVSVGAIIHAIRLLESTEEGDIFISEDWEPVEFSFVSIPKDASVGVGRALDEGPAAPPTTTPSEVTSVMSREEREDVFAVADEILGWADRFHVTEFAREFLRDKPDATRLEFFAALKANKAAKQAATATPAPLVELTEKEAKRYSLTAACRSLLEIRSGRKRENSFEWEVSDQVEKELDGQERREQDVSFERHGGLFVPTNLPAFAHAIPRRHISPELRAMMKRAGLDTKTATKGAETIFTERGSFIDFLYNKALVMQLGATMLNGLVGNVDMPKQSGTAQAYWVDENPSSGVTESELSLATVSLRAKTLMARTFTTRQLLRQSTPAIDALMQADISRALALQLDRTALHGTGTSGSKDFKGIYKLANVNVVAFGGAPTFGKIVDMETAICDDNADFGMMAYLTTPAVRGKAKQTQKFSGTNGEPLWNMGELNGLRAEATNQVSKTMTGTDATGGSNHGFVLGVWESLVFGEWGAMELLVDEYTQSGKALIYVTAFMMADMCARYDEAFCVGTGVTP